MKYVLLLRYLTKFLLSKVYKLQDYGYLNTLHEIFFFLFSWDFWRPARFCIMRVIHNINVFYISNVFKIYFYILNIFYILKAYDAQQIHILWLEDTCRQWTTRFLILRGNLDMQIRNMLRRPWVLKLLP